MKLIDKELIRLCFVIILSISGVAVDAADFMNGQVFITSGYEKWAEAPGNVLLVYSLDGN